MITRQSESDDRNLRSDSSPFDEVHVSSLLIAGEDLDPGLTAAWESFFRAGWSAYDRLTERRAVLARQRAEATDATPGTSDLKSAEGGAEYGSLS